MHHLINRFRPMSGYVHTGFGHDFDCGRIQTVRFDAGGIDIEPVVPEMTGPALGHLASAGIAGAEKENGLFHCNL
jgi:hypothetical protein